MVCFYVVSPKIYSLKDSLNCKLKNMCTFDLFSYCIALVWMWACVSMRTVYIQWHPAGRSQSK